MSAVLHTRGDRASVLDAIDLGVDSLRTLTSDWHTAELSESSIIGAERSLVGLQTLLAKLRTHVPPSRGAV